MPTTMMGLRNQRAMTRETCSIRSARTMVARLIPRNAPMAIAPPITFQFASSSPVSNKVASSEEAITNSMMPT